MKKIPLVIIIVGIIIAVSLISFYSTSPSVSESGDVKPINFIYFDIDEIYEVLLAEDILISTPIPITDHTIDQYCSYIDRQNIKRSVPYCLTTALINPDGTALGNLNMGGNPITPVVALSILEVPSLDSYSDEVAFVFQTMIDTLVCDCWASQQPGGFESVSAWIDAAKQEHIKSPQTTLKSKIDDLAQKQIVLEITALENSYLFTFVIIA